MDSTGTPGGKTDELNDSDEQNDRDDETIVNSWKKRSYEASKTEESELLRQVKKMRADGLFTNLQSLTKLTDGELSTNFQIPRFHADEFRASLDPFRYENELNGKLIVHRQESFDLGFIDCYLPEASTFRSRQGSAYDSSTRPAPFRAFLGPSGSGKTFSAIKQEFATNFSQINKEHHQRFCTLYMTVSSFWKAPLNFVDAAEKAWLIHFEKSKEHKLKMVVHVVVDEAGFDESIGGYFEWSLPELSQLQAVLQRYAVKVVISVVGTNLESVLSGSTDSSGTGLAKYRPTPWTWDILLALVPNIRKAYKVAKELTDEDAREKLKKWILDVPIFGALAGNGRAAVKFVQVVFQLFDQSRDPVENVAGVVDAVAKVLHQQQWAARS